MNITVFRVQTGQIAKTVQCPAGMANIQCQQGEDWIDGAYLGDAYYIDNFTPIAKPPKPSEHHIFDYATKQWFDPRTLEDLKSAKNAAINAARLRANQGTFTFAGKQIKVDPMSRGDIDGVHGYITGTGEFPPGWPGGWKATDNTMVAIADVQTWMQFYQAMVMQGTANFNHAQSLKAQLEAATTKAQVEAIPDW